MKPRLLIVYPCFPPAFRAGGIIQSLASIVAVLGARCDVRVLTSAYDLGETEPHSDVKLNRWVTYGESALVYYATAGRMGSGLLSTLWREWRPDAVYLNGIFLARFVLLPARFFLQRNVSTVIAPRGMLQAGALSLKKLRKVLFLAFMRILLPTHRIRWHATDGQEADDIRAHFGGHAEIDVVPPAPRPLKVVTSPVHVEGGPVKAVTVSVIAEKKNYHLILEALKLVKPTRNWVYDIYGPVKDHAYWVRCRKLIESMPHYVTVRVHEAIPPQQVDEVLSQAHMFLLPTRGENFGHAIYEALGNGCPAIISQHTPWKELQSRGAGIIWESERGVDGLVEAMNAIAGWDAAHYGRARHAARRYASDYLSQCDFPARYFKLFFPDAVALANRPLAAVKNSMPTAAA